MTAPVGSDDRAVEVEDLITAWGLLTEAVVAVARRLSEGLAAAGPLSLPEFDVLVRLHREPTRRVPLARIADELGVSFAGLAKLTNRMELDGTIVCAGGDLPPHAIHATITRQGDDLVRHVLDRHTSDLRRHLLDPLGPDGLRELAALTRVLRDTNA